MSERKGTKGLELWCKRLVDGYPGVKIDNMTTSWRNGLAFCAIIHHFRPDLIDFSSLKADDIYYNNELAYRTAETHLGIPALLDPEDMVDNDVPDRLSILTYLSQFYQRLGNKGLVKQKSVTPVQGTQISSVTPSHNLNLTRLKSSKSGYEKCTKCDLPVYLAQRLLVSHRLYHRGCFRCSKCQAQLSPANCYENEAGTEFCCESCKNNETTSTLPPDDDKMGMLLFDDHPYEKENIILSKGFDRQKSSLIGSSILEKINAFENRDKMGKSMPLLPLSADQVDGKHLNTGDNTKMFDQIKTIETNSDSNNSSVYLNSASKVSENDKTSAISYLYKSDLALNRSPDKPSVTDVTLLSDKMTNNLSLALDTPTIPQRRYRNNASKINFMQTQLTTETEKDKSPKDVESAKPPPINRDTFPVSLYDYELNKSNESRIKSDIPERAKSTDFKSSFISSNGLEKRYSIDIDVINSSTTSNESESLQNRENNKTDSDALNKEEPVEEVLAQNSGPEEPMLPKLPCFEINGPSLEHTDNSVTPNIVEDVKCTNGESVESDKTNTTQVTETAHDVERHMIHDVEIIGAVDVEEGPTTNEVLPSNNDEQEELNSDKVHSTDLKVSNENEKKYNNEDANTDEIVFSDPVTLADKNIEPVLVEAVSDARKKQIEDKIQEDDEKTYPVHLNPFSDDEDDEDDLVMKRQPAKHVSTNPFGSSDEDDDTPSKLKTKSETTPEKPLAPMKRVIHALNPFWSDGEEPSSEDDAPSTRYSARIKSNWSTSTPSIPVVSPRRKKPKAPKPPNIVVLEAPIPAPRLSRNDEMCSLTSLSSHGSTAYSDTTKSLTPKSRKKRPAPTPPSSRSSLRVPLPSPRRGVDDYSDTKSDVTTDYSLQKEVDEDAEDKISKWRRHKGPAPGLPLPGRRVVRTELTLNQLQSELDLLEVQQQGLEKQGVLLEQMIREKCEMYQDGNDESVVQEVVKEAEQSVAVPQEVVEDLVIQLCELVNEKNDLFRKQAELMYIRRHQRLEQEQADIEHEIRIIQSRPAVNRIDSDKAREEYLVNRLIAIVRQRDELVQQLDSDRRREMAEDEAIAVSIAQRRASRTTDSNNSSLQSVEITPKKVKVKDRVKKQLKKAKLSTKLHLKKKESDRPEGEAPEKESKTKWF